ncbi:MAG: LytTR family transcriptional regulator DNA-binding domain-containing protein [Rubrivivax sp.]|nr:LytTR family transcriptional regulator DNA-binding domain-containing protein [Rubrivivax sp.]
MDPKAHAVSPLYLLERFDVGIVQLDAERRVVAMNTYARRVLPVDDKQPFDRMVLSFHPERSQPKVEFLLDQAAQCPVSNPPPMAMIINIPERVLLIKVARMADAADRTSGYTLVFYDITELVSSDERPTATRRRLQKIPTVVQQRIVLVDAEDVLCIHSDGHYTRVCTTEGSQFCNLNIGDLESRLDPEHFMRVHRGHIVNLRRVRQLRRDDGRLLIELREGEPPIPVSRSSTAELLERLGIPAGGSVRAT